MIVTRVLSATSRCNACQLALLRAFTSLAGSPVEPLKDRTQRVWQSKPFSTLPGRSLDVVLLQETTRTVENIPGTVNETETAGDPSIASAAPLPWYLQVDTPQAPAYPLSDRQRLPEIPINPPPILEPLLKYISIDLGLDDLTLFDLKGLDPPPALGANLLMLLGTARSERHLHVSADRLCRWLRSTHQLTPFADGLLGRNELKLKMRRKARRAKLLGSVGASQNSNPDDGIRTGWVCVNVGTVESGHEDRETIETVEFVGFGSRAGGVKIVVQMLTEEKRGELDLEDLWGGMLRRQAKRDIKNTESE